MAQSVCEQQSLNQYKPENRDLLEKPIGTKIKIKKVAFRKPKAHHRVHSSPPSAFILTFTSK